ncbi:CDP-glycerol glycerophosphotransferase family protein [Vibrio harveyi]|uniref:CDP-glycerol glycerophosphotransferase family protein n=1 Tax=Vibrio harveyi TaxID=669 RepID=UPI0003A3427C|nr:CDP-glycerol glycerophosphotransferase family protein [Vibrio harveyi]MBY7701401.1 CDP-glycerol glycerophosphotransferase family protein [Vibrio harveyi]PNM53131.1 CDP-glycerol--glycerophosphate glycerophosphotransferase [Vibrio harveyi]UIL57637.1 CDP-glycerol glycerophosphotransferase family protein [Vibrio harveyi]SQA27838.1 CDP-glycerol:poly(glycerophosphate) glycerophosphotransferase [Vibrio harveyi]
MKKYNLRKALKLFIKHLYLKSVYGLFKLLKLEKGSFIFSSFYGEQYSGDPKAIYETLRDYNYGKRIVWVLNSNEIIDDCVIVKRYSLRHFYYLATSEFRVDNCQESYLLKPKPESIYLQTWHGTPLKKIAQDIEDNRFSRIKKDWFKDANSWSYLLSSSDNIASKLSNAFSISRDRVLEIGYPRNDLFFSCSNEKMQEIKNELGLPKRKKVILYAPTFRDGNSKFDLNLDLDVLNKKLGNDYIFLIRMHSNIKRSSMLSYEKNIIDVSNYHDVQNLMLISDVLVTDYSSLFFDYAILKRKMIFYAYDLEEYESVCRGFYYNYKEFVPGDLVYNQNELIDSIFDESFDLQRVIDFNREFNPNSDNVSESVLRKLGVIDD